MKTSDIRLTFLNYFSENGHAVKPSSALVPHNDPTLMFTNAGMVQFKNYFTGAEKPDTARAATSQKCVRAGGKHNDLDNVGYTKRHLTFFEMLGNFSFGDYFKEDAIRHAWTLLTEHFKLPKEKLSVTVYHTDDEAFGLWQKIAGLPDEKILRIPTSDNFWSMGDTGPCGPCSEIFYDHGPALNGEWKLDAEGNDLFDERFVEIWNLVFMQYEQKEDGSRISLPKPSIDTGMGLERISSVLQGKTDVYDTDLFRTLIEASKRESGAGEEGEAKVSHRIIADHLRSSCFLMADGVMPSNEGRGYVLRRIMRRAMRHAHQLGCAEPLMYKLVPALVAEMGEAYPELLRAQALITENLRSEEERFKQTLDRGLKLLEEERTKQKILALDKMFLQFNNSPELQKIVQIAQKLDKQFSSSPELQKTVQMAKKFYEQLSNNSEMKKALMEAEKINTSASLQELENLIPSVNPKLKEWIENSRQLQGEVAFKLYDTYGFPLDLTETILRDSGQTVDIEGFNAAMAKQKEMARAAWVGSGAQAVNVQWFDLKEKTGAVEFLGYAQEEGEAVVKALVVNGEPVEQAAAGSEAMVVTNQTPFYGESGGQMGDTGVIAIDGKKVADVLDTTKPLEDFIVHRVKLTAALKLGDTVHLSIDAARRNRIRANHSATHILHKVLRDRIGDHVTQKGSLVAPDRLRFDISHPKALTREELAAVEAEVNRIIWLNEDVRTEVTTPDKAIEKGAMALFGEKYGDEVRVVSMGDQLAPSIEFCGGTHVRRTGDIGLFKIVSEGAVAAGIRRLEAVTGPDAYAYMTQQENALRETAAALKAPLAEVPEKAAALVEERRKLEKQLADAKRAQALGGAGAEEVKPETIGNVTYLAKAFPDLPPKELRSIADTFRKKTGAQIIAVGTGFEGKASLVVSVSQDVQAQFSAVDLVNAGAALVGGRGGGKPDMAQAGGSEGGKLEDALKAIRETVATRLAS